MQYTDSGGTDSEALVLLHAGVFADWFIPLDHQPALADMRRIRVTRTGYANDPPVTPLTTPGSAPICCAHWMSTGRTWWRTPPVPCSHSKWRWTTRTWYPISS